jgi:A/G-specific adenine glycosylase
LRDNCDLKQISRPLLDWYDTNARKMAWRISPKARAEGIRPNPYRVWLSEVMLQQTTVAAVKEYFDRFTRRWPTVEDLACASDAEVIAEWAGLGYYARARNLLACARKVTLEYGGKFPTNRVNLLALPGIGPYTAAAISAIAFDLPEPVLDGNVERVMTRLYAVRVPLPTSKPQLLTLVAAETPLTRPGDYAQAVMDLGATICRPRSPSCGVCPLRDLCNGRAQGIATSLPFKTAKVPKPTRNGTMWLAQRNDGAWLLELRSPKGLLGGTMGWPGDAWDNVSGPPPLSANWRDAGTLRHTFTHFHLNLQVLTATVGTSVAPVRGTFIPPNDFNSQDLPSLMRKAYGQATLK